MDEEITRRDLERILREIADGTEDPEEVVRAVLAYGFGTGRRGPGQPPLSQAERARRHEDLAERRSEFSAARMVLEAMAAADTSRPWGKPVTRSEKARDRLQSQKKEITPRAVLREMFRVSGPDDLSDAGCDAFADHIFDRYEDLVAPYARVPNLASPILRKHFGLTRR
jgi:hypothetical protein